MRTRVGFWSSCDATKRSWPMLHKLRFLCQVQVVAKCWILLISRISSGGDMFDCPTNVRSLRCGYIRLNRRVWIILAVKFMCGKFGLEF